MTPSHPVERLGEAIADLAARIHAATYELLIMLRQFDEQMGWNTGFLSCAPRARSARPGKHWRSQSNGLISV